MASVYKRGSVWWVRFQWNGEEIRRSARTTAKGEARQYLADLQAEYRRVGLGGRPRIPFPQAAVAYIQEHVSRLKESTIASYQRAVAVLRDEFGGMYLDEISRAKIAAFEVKQLRIVSPSTVHHYRAALSGIFRVAIRHEWVDLNPCQNLDPVRINNARERFLTEAEWRRLKAQLQDPLLGAAEVCVARGMRLGEVLAMKWRHVDHDADTIAIPDSKANRPRMIPLERAAEPIKRQARTSEYVFCTSTGAKMRQDDASRRIGRAAKRAGITDFKPHDLRHTFASWYVQRGGDLYRLQKILGHKGPTMTQRYAHLLVDDLRDPTQIWAQTQKTKPH